MSAHTPGPWKYGVRKDGSMWLSLGDWRTGSHFQADLCASDADAKLICAAPELLAALTTAEAALADIGDSEGDPEPTSEWCVGRAYRVLATIRAVIAKAKGEA